MSRHHGPGKLRRAICPECSREVAVYVPTTSRDGREVFRSHRRTPGATIECEGWGAFAPPASSPAGDGYSPAAGPDPQR